MICPKDLKGCCDDICHGSGCIQMGGEPMLHQCKKCGSLQEYFVLYGCEDCEDREEEMCSGCYEHQIYCECGI